MRLWLILGREAAIVGNGLGRRVGLDGILRIRHGCARIPWGRKSIAETLLERKCRITVTRIDQLLVFLLLFVFFSGLATTVSGGIWIYWGKHERCKE